MSAYRNIIVPLAKDLGVSDYAVKQWRVRGSVPHKWRLPMLDLAKQRRKRLQPTDFDGLDSDVKRRGAA